MDKIFQNKYYIDQGWIDWGMYGKIYRGEHLSTKKKVVIKELNNVEDAKRESHVMKSYGNYNYFPLFYELIIYDGKVFIVMEYVEGEKIGTIFPDSIGPRHPELLSINITLNILEALTYLHQVGFSHMDIIPQNILVHNWNPNTVKIIDFGLSKELDHFSEQYDIRNVGLTCLYLINGHAPVNNENIVGPFEMENKKLQEILNIAIFPSNHKRFQSVREFMEALAHYKRLIIK